MEGDKSNVVYLSQTHPPLSLEEFKDRLFDAINEGSFLPVTDIRTKDRENRIEILLSQGEIFEITVKEQPFARSANYIGCDDLSGLPKAGVTIPKKEQPFARSANYIGCDDLSGLPEAGVTIPKKEQPFARSANYIGCDDLSGLPKAGVTIPKKETT